jgi:hypothetical protein
MSSPRSYNVTLFHGKAGSGKNYHARLLAERLAMEGVKCLELAFANHLKADVAGRGMLSIEEATASTKTLAIRTALTSVGQTFRDTNVRYFSLALFTTMDLLADQGITHFIITDLRFRSELSHTLEVYPQAKLYSISAPNRTYKRYMYESKGVYEDYERISTNISETDLDEVVASSGLFEIIPND